MDEMIKWLEKLLDNDLEFIDTVSSETEHICEFFLYVVHSLLERVVEIAKEQSISVSEAFETVTEENYAESLIDVYTSDLVDWLSDLDHCYYVDEAIKEGTTDSCANMLQMGQLFEIREAEQVVSEIIEKRESFFYNGQTM